MKLPEEVQLARAGFVKPGRTSDRLIPRVVERNVGWMETDHDHVTRCCRPSHARRNARKGQAAFALVSRTRRSDGSRRHSGAGLSSGVVVRGGFSLGRPADYKRYR